MPKSGQLSDLTSHLAIRWSQLRIRLLYKKDEISRELEYIEDIIKDLESIERILMRERYINGKEWEKICVIINYSWRQTHRLHSKILDELTEKLAHDGTQK